MKKLLITLGSIIFFAASITATVFITKNIDDKDHQAEIKKIKSNAKGQSESLADDLDYLPLGSIVTLKNGDGTKLIIIGRMNTLENADGDQGYFEYSAVPYPAGIDDPDQILFFNREDVDQTIYTGFADKDEKNQQDKMDDINPNDSVVPKFNLDDF